VDKWLILCYNIEKWQFGNISGIDIAKILPEKKPIKMGTELTFGNMVISFYINEFKNQNKICYNIKYVCIMIFDFCRTYCQNGKKGHFYWAFSWQYLGNIYARDIAKLPILPYYNIK